MVVFDKNLTLKMVLNEYKKDYLKMLADYLDITGLSKLKKMEIAERIADVLLKEDVMFYRLSVFGDEELSVFEKGLNGPVDLSCSDDEHDMAYSLSEVGYAAISGQKFLVPCDVVSAWKKLKSEKFDNYRQRASWVWRCLYFAEELYGCFSAKNLLDIINSKVGMNMDLEEMIDIYSHFPVDQLNTVTNQGAFFEIRYIEDEELFESLLALQADKPFYVPTEEEVNEFYSTCELVSDKCYRDLENFLRNEMFMDELESRDILSELWDTLSVGGEINELIQWLMDEIDLVNEEDLKTVIKLLMDCANGTRMLTNRGYKPVELFEKGDYGNNGNPQIVPVSSDAARILKEMAPQMNRMGIDIDIDGDSKDLPVMSMPEGLGGPVIRGTKKVYPNDPCPCGSGKKFKKCCGRN